MYQTQRPLGFVDAGMRASKIPLIEHYMSYKHENTVGFINHQSNAITRHDYLESEVEPHRLFGPTPPPLPWSSRLPVGILNAIPQSTKMEQLRDRALVHSVANQPISNFIIATNTW